MDNWNIRRHLVKGLQHRVYDMIRDCFYIDERLECISQDFQSMLVYLERIGKLYKDNYKIPKEKFLNNKFANSMCVMFDNTLHNIDNYPNSPYYNILLKIQINIDDLCIDLLQNNKLYKEDILRKIKYLVEEINLQKEFIETYLKHKQK